MPTKARPRTTGALSRQERIHVNRGQRPGAMPARQFRDLIAGDPATGGGLRLVEQWLDDGRTVALYRRLTPAGGYSSTTRVVPVEATPPEQLPDGPGGDKPSEFALYAWCTPLRVFA